MCAQETQKTEENERGVDLNINIYYGGRGIIDDPTIYVINKMQEVLEELRVHVERYNLYDGKTNITTLPQTLKEADGIILATTVEWYGIGGYMQQFLDAFSLSVGGRHHDRTHINSRDRLFIPIQPAGIQKLLHIATCLLYTSTDGSYPPTPSNHRLRRGLPGYLILFAPHAFEPPRQLPSSKPPSPLVFLSLIHIS